MKRIVEVKGVKIEVDDRNAKKVESYSVGDKVKVLVKYYDAYKSHPGVVVGFDEFQNLPTVVVAYVTENYGGSTVEFAYLNASEKCEIEICPASDDILSLSRDVICDQIDQKIAAKQNEVQELVNKKNVFLKYFGAIAR